MIVMSGSMEPEIKTGSLCFVNTKTEYSKIKENDIITYSIPDSYITHRVIEVTDQGLITKGDSNSSQDFGIITEENYYGKTAGHIPYAGYVLFYLKKYIFLLATAIITVHLIYRSVCQALKIKQ